MNTDLIVKNKNAIALNKDFSSIYMEGDSDLHLIRIFLHTRLPLVCADNILSFHDDYVVQEVLTGMVSKVLKSYGYCRPWIFSGMYSTHLATTTTQSLLLMDPNGFDKYLTGEYTNDDMELYAPGMSEDEILDVQYGLMPWIVGLYVRKIEYDIAATMAFSLNPIMTPSMISYEDAGEDYQVSLLPELVLESGDFDLFAGMDQFNRFLPHFIFKKEDIRYYVKLLEDVLHFRRLAMNTVVGESRFDTILHAFVIFIKLRYSEALVYTISDKLIPYMQNVIIGSLDMSEVGVESGDFSAGEFLTKARDHLTSAEKFKDSMIMEKLKRCIFFALSTSLFTKMGLSFDAVGYSRMEEAAMRKKFGSTKLDTMLALGDAVLFLAERGYQIYLTRDPETIFHSGGQYQKVFEKTRELERRKNLLSNPEEHGFTESEYRADLDDTIEKLKSVNKHSHRLDKIERKNIEYTLNSMLMIRDDITTKRAARRNRKAPFGVLLYSASGQGKTTVTSMLVALNAAHKKLPQGSEFIYTRNPADPFWSGFNSSCHTIILDDVAYKSPNLGDSSSVDEIIQVMNNVALCPNQASLEEKGRTPVLADFVIATTNVKDLNAFHYFACPSATQRRLPNIITPKVKKEYLDAYGMLHVPDDVEPSAFPDYWTFTVEKVLSQPEARIGYLATTRTILQDVDQKTFFKWFLEEREKFDIEQMKIKKCVELQNEIVLCQSCGLPDTICGCGIVLETDDYIWYHFAILPLILFMYGFWKSDYMSPIRVRIYRIKWLVTWFFWFDEKTSMARAKANYYMYRAQTADYWYFMGEAMIGTFSVGLLFSTISSILTTWLTTVRWKGVELESDVNGLGHMPVSDLRKRTNVWYNDSYSLTSSNFTPASTSSKGMNFENFCDKISKNCIVLTCLTIEGKFRPCRAICLGGHIYLTNNHNIPECVNTMDVKIIQGPQSQGVTSNIQFKMSEDCIHRYPERDLAILIIRQNPPKKNITKYFLKGDVKTVLNGAYVTRDYDGNTRSIPVHNSRCSTERVKNKELSHEVAQKVWISTRKDVTGKGFCGSPLVLNSSYGYFIAGIHFAFELADESAVVALNINQEMVASFYNKFEKYGVESGNFDRISSDNIKMTLGELHYKSPFRYIEKGVANVFGSLLNTRARPKSRVSKSIFYSFLSKKGMQTKFCQPDMTSWVCYGISAEKMVAPVVNLDEGILSKCVEGFIKDANSRMVDRERPQKEFHILDLRTAINGNIGTTWLDPLNKKTSAGAPWNRSKLCFLIPDEPGEDCFVPSKLVPEMEQRMSDLLNVYKEYKMAHPLFRAHLKDEPVSERKALTGKTRVFGGVGMDWTILVRMFLLGFIRMVQNERYAFECAVGITTASLEWEELYDHITKFGCETIVAGDYESYDKTMSPVESLAVGDIVEYYARESGNFSDEEIKIIRCIFEDAAYPLYDYNGDLIQFFGTNPSGWPLTVIINCIVGSLRFRYCYYVLNPKKEVKSFLDNVSLMTYGDDNICSVNKNIPWFNHTSITSVFSDVGIGYTMPDKESISVPYITMNEATFLKRTWVWSEDLMSYACQLDNESINKMLMVVVQSKEVCEEEQMASIVISAMREYFMYGREKYETMSIILREAMELHDLTVYIKDATFLSYDSLLLEYKKSSRYCLSYDKHYGHLELESGDIEGSYSFPLDKYGWYRPPSILDQECQNHKCSTGVRRENHSNIVSTNECGLGLMSISPLISGKATGYSFLKMEKTFDNYNYKEYELESEDSGIDLTIVPTSSNEIAQNVEFEDMDNNVILNIPYNISAANVDTSQNVELGNFLKRPVQIKEINWQIGTEIDTVFFPWSEYYLHPSIKKKIDNYYLLRCNLHLKIVVNASPFYYGAAIASYSPMEFFSPSPVLASAAGLDLVPMSQRPHIYIYPQSSQGGDMILPFIYYKNWIDVTSAADVADMGALNIKSFGNLLNANGLTSDTINILVYAWAEDVEVAGPTIALAMESGDMKPDEYGFDGPVSRPASAIARAAGLLENVPVIGSFATATSYAAGQVASIASLFGFTNVPVIDDVKAFRNHPFPNMASTDIGTPVEKLTLDAKNELSVDASVVSVSADDEMNISAIVQKESYIWTATWTSANVTNDSLFFTKVTPRLIRSETPATIYGTALYYTPMAHVSEAFEYWRGSIIFRIKIICTKYHRGRLRINWDPHGAIGVTGDYTTEVYTKVVDITKETDVEFVVPYTQETSYLNVHKFYGHNMATTSNNPPNNLYENGVLTLRVLSAQTSPVTSADIKVLIFAKGGPDLEFAGPSSINNKLSYYADLVVESGDYDHDPTSLHLGQYPCKVDPNINLIYMGESIKSIRSLVRRTGMYFRALAPAVGSATAIYELETTLSRCPLYPGFDTNGINGAVSSDASDKTYNFTNWHYVTWFSPCYIGERGSYIYSMNLCSVGNVTSATISRANNIHTYAEASSVTTFSSMAGIDWQAQISRNVLTDGLEGQATVNQNSQAGIVALVPLYSRFKIVSTTPIYRTNGSSIDETDTDSVHFRAAVQSNATVNLDLTYQDIYVSAGTDYNLIFYLNVPTIYLYSTVPVAAVRP